MALDVEAQPIPIQTDRDGVARVGGTRVTLDTIVAAFDEGATAEEIADQYPSINRADVYAVLAYCIRHRPDVDAYLRQRQQRAAAVRAENESRFDPRGVRARLLTRRRDS
jgi:uncharacterized protein (DUF433 family)